MANSHSELIKTYETVNEFELITRIFEYTVQNMKAAIDVIVL